MCMSPHEMSSARIEQTIAHLDQELADDPDDIWARWRRDELVEVLKERAEAGTYHADHTDRTGHATARQGRR